MGGFASGIRRFCGFCEFRKKIVNKKPYKQGEKKKWRLTKK